MCASCPAKSLILSLTSSYFLSGRLTCFYLIKTNCCRSQTTVSILFRFDVCEMLRMSHLLSTRLRKFIQYVDAHAWGPSCYNPWLLRSLNLRAIDSISGVMILATLQELCELSLFLFLSLSLIHTHAHKNVLCCIFHMEFHRRSFWCAFFRSVQQNSFPSGGG